MTDWPQIIRDIRRHGRMRLIDIAAECDCSEGTLCDIVIGRTREPRWTLGDKLKRLHSETVPRETGNSEVSMLGCA